jgi:RNA polymerase sigma factor (sigma-70 family)
MMVHIDKQTVVHSDGAQNYQSDFFEHYKLVEILVKKRFKVGALAEEAKNYVLEYLSANDWEKLRNYRKKGSFKAYLTQVVNRTLEDFSRKRFGRVRPPAHVLVRGTLWTRLFQLMCVEGYSPLDASHIILQEFPELYDTNFAFQTARDVRGSVVDCGKKTTELSFEEEPETAETDNRPLLCQTPEDILEEVRRMDLLEALHALLLSFKDEQDVSASPNLEYYEQILQAIDYSDIKDRLLLRMIYQDGLTLSKAGAVLGLTTSQTHSRLKGLLERIRLTISEDNPPKV